MNLSRHSGRWCSSFAAPLVESEPRDENIDAMSGPPYLRPFEVPFPGIQFAGQPPSGFQEGFEA